MTSYEMIYSRFLSKITDFDLANVPDNELNDMLGSWLLSAIAKFRRPNSDLNSRDDSARTFNIDLLNDEIEILALLMVAEWIEPQLNSVLYTSQFFGGKEEKLKRCAALVRCIWKRCSVYSRICWNPLRDVIPMQKDEISLGVTV